MPAKNRSVGITVIAILAFIGSALFLLFAGFMAIAMFAAPDPGTNDPRLPPMFFNVIRIALPLFYALPAIWGIVSATGLLLLKNWARISTIIFSILLIVFGVFGMLSSMIFFLKPPPGNGLDPKMFPIIGGITAFLALAQIGVGIWWIVFFNRAGVKAQFLSQTLPYSQMGQGTAPYGLAIPYSATPPPPPLASTTDLAPTATPPTVAPAPSARPLSISIIAWLMLISCLVIPFNIVFHAPAILFTAILTGWPAVIVLLVFTAVHLYIGIALLKMQPAGRLTGIGYFVFGILNFIVFYLAPGRNARVARLLEVEQSMFSWMRSAQANAPFTPEMTPFFIAIAIVIAVIYLVLIYFLAAAKPAFDRAARERLG